MATYIHGNTVRKEAAPAIGEQPRQQKPVSRQVKQNRNKAFALISPRIIRENSQISAIQFEE